MLVDHDTVPLAAVAADLPGAVAVPGDAADPAVATRAAEAARTTHGGLDVLIANAGTTHDGAFTELPDEAWRQVVRDGLDSAVATARACLAVMAAQARAELAAQDGATARHRAAVLTASAATLTGSPGQASLSAAGGAVLGLVRTLAREFGPYGITVNAVVPGFVETRLTAADPDGVSGVPEPVRQMTRAMTALGRFGQPEEVAAVHAFLASDATFVTGAAIPVTGGLLGTL